MKVLFPVYLRISFLILTYTNVLDSWFSIQMPRYAHWAVGAQLMACLLMYFVSVIQESRVPSISND